MPKNKLSSSNGSSTQLARDMLDSNTVDSSTVDSSTVMDGVGGDRVGLRSIAVDDLATITEFEYSVSIVEPHGDIAELTALHAVSGLWATNAGAVAIVRRGSTEMIGTLQFYVGAPCIHGIELGYVIHSQSNRGKGYAAEALRLFSDFLFDSRPLDFRQQLMIEVWNTASWKVAERSGFVREGILRSSGFGTGDPADSFVYSRTRRDWNQQQQSFNGT